MGQALGDMGKGIRDTWWSEECCSDYYFPEAIQETIQEGDDHVFSHRAGSMVFMKHSILFCSQKMCSLISPTGELLLLIKTERRETPPSSSSSSPFFCIWGQS